MKKIVLLFVTLALATSLFAEAVSAREIRRDVNVWGQLSQQKQSELIAFLNQFDMGAVDVTKMSDGEIVEYLHYANHYGLISIERKDEALSILPMLQKPMKKLEVSEESYDWDYYAESFLSYNQMSQKLFNITLSAGDNDYAYWDNGTIYLPDLAFGGSTEYPSYQVTSLYDLGQHQYYVEFKVYDLYMDDDSYDYNDPVGYERAMHNKLTNKSKTPISKWKQENGILSEYRGIQGSAVLKKDTSNGVASWKLIKIDRELPKMQLAALTGLLNNMNLQNEPSTWAKGEMNTARQQGLIPDGLQRWYGNHITRAEFSKLIVNALVKEEGSLDNLLRKHGASIQADVFQDTKNKYILTAHALGIASGQSKNSFNPSGLITREEAAVMLARTATLQNVSLSNNDVSFNDDSKISSWAKVSVAAVTNIMDASVSQSVMGSKGNNSFKPKDNITKQEAIIAVKRLYAAF